MEWGTCLEAMEAALELEKMVNQSLLELTKAADDKGDSHLSDFLDEFLEDQVASIKSIGDNITKLKRVGDGLGLPPLGLFGRVLGGSGGLNQEHRGQHHKAEEGWRWPWTPTSRTFWTSSWRIRWPQSRASGTTSQS